jgi:hypothetical protein
VTFLTLSGIKAKILADGMLADAAIRESLAVRGRIYAVKLGIDLPAVRFQHFEFFTL